MKFFGTDWVKKAEELKTAWEKAQRMHNFASPGQKLERLQELNAAKKAYDEALGKALKQKAEERKKAKEKKKK